MLPPLASVEDLAAWLGLEIAVDDPRAAEVLNAASTLVRSYTEDDWTEPDSDPVELVDDLPDSVHTVTVQVAARAWQRPGDVESATQTAGPFGQTSRYFGDGGGL